MSSYCECERCPCCGKLVSKPAPIYPMPGVTVTPVPYIPPTTVPPWTVMPFEWPFVPQQPSVQPTWVPNPNFPSITISDDGVPNPNFPSITISDDGTLGTGTFAVGHY